MTGVFRRLHRPIPKRRKPRIGYLQWVFSGESETLTHIASMIGMLVDVGVIPSTGAIPSASSQSTASNASSLIGEATATAAGQLFLEVTEHRLTSMVSVEAVVSTSTPSGFATSGSLISEVVCTSTVGVGHVCVSSAEAAVPISATATSESGSQTAAFTDTYVAALSSAALSTQETSSTLTASASLIAFSTITLNVLADLRGVADRLNFVYAFDDNLSTLLQTSVGVTLLCRETVGTVTMILISKGLSKIPAEKVP